MVRATDSGRSRANLRATSTLLLSAQLLALGHLLIVRHTICPEHGEAIHSGSASKAHALVPTHEHATDDQALAMGALPTTIVCPGPTHASVSPCCGSWTWRPARGWRLHRCRGWQPSPRSQPWPCSDSRQRTRLPRRSPSQRQSRTEKVRGRERPCPFVFVATLPVR